MKAVLTGDIINSQSIPSRSWLGKLKSTLSLYGQNPKHWEIFRGDSFQLALEAETALMSAFHIKAEIKQLKGLGIRIAVGIGQEEYSAERVTESNGTAYIRSGECFDNLKKQTLLIKSADLDLDLTINLMLNLAMITADNWTPTVARVISYSFQNPEKSQIELAKELERTQSSISESLNRGGYDGIQELIEYYKLKVKAL